MREEKKQGRKGKKKGGKERNKKEETKMREGVNLRVLNLIHDSYFFLLYYFRVGSPLSVNS